MLLLISLTLVSRKPRTVFGVCVMDVFERLFSIRSGLCLDKCVRYRADCEAGRASERLITVWDKDSSVISSPSHSYRHKHINPTLPENNDIKPVILIHPIVSDVPG